jgi:hypothetical protein
MIIFFKRYTAIEPHRYQELVRESKENVAIYWSEAV